MTLYEFNALPSERPLVLAVDEETFLARRWEEEDGINLYRLPGKLLLRVVLRYAC